MSSRDSNTGGASPDEVREYHTRYLRAVSIPLRREILRALKSGDETIEVLQSRTGLDMKMLEWHLDMLENGFCVKRETRNGKVFYKLTKEGRVIDYL